MFQENKKYLKAIRKLGKETKRGHLQKRNKKRKQPNKTLVSLSKKKRRHKSLISEMKMGTHPTDPMDIKRIIKKYYE